jgi:hypothetical protein
LLRGMHEGLLRVCHEELLLGSLRSGSLNRLRECRLRLRHNGLLGKLWHGCW